MAHRSTPNSGRGDDVEGKDLTDNDHINDIDIETEIETKTKTKVDSEGGVMDEPKKLDEPAQRKKGDNSKIDLHWNNEQHVMGLEAQLATIKDQIDDAKVGLKRKAKKFDVVVSKKKSVIEKFSNLVAMEHSNLHSLHDLICYHI